MKFHRGILILHPKVKVPATDIEAMRAAGYIPIVAEHQHVRLQPPVSQVLGGGEIGLAAIRALAVNEYARRMFGQYVFESLLTENGMAVVDGKVVRR